MVRHTLLVVSEIAPDLIVHVFMNYPIISLLHRFFGYIQEYLREERAQKHEIKKEVYIDRRFVVLFK